MTSQGFRAVHEVQTIMTQNELFSKRSAYPAQFDDLWSRYPKRPGNPKRAALRAFNRHCKHYSAEVIGAGVDAYRRYCEATGVIGTPFVMHAATFFGPSLHFLEDWDCEELSESRTASDIWNQIVEAAAQSASARQQFIESCKPEVRAAINAVGGLKWIGTRQHYDLKRLGDQFIEELKREEPR